MALLLAFIHLPAMAADAVVAADLGAMGGAGAGAGDNNASVTTNPGLLGLYERYDFHGHFQYGADAQTRWGASIVDGRTSKWLAMGLFYAGDRANPAIRPEELPGWTLAGEDPTNIRRHHNLTFGVAAQGWDRRFSVGLSGTLAVFNHDRHGAGSTGNMDAGLGFRPADALDLGVAVRNVLPIVSPDGDLLLTVAGGARVHGKAGELLADFEWREDADVPFTVAGGGELPFADMSAFRGGYRFEGPTGLHKATAGFGLVGPGGSLDVGFQLPVAPQPPTIAGLAFLVSVRIEAPSEEDVLEW